MDNLGTWEDKDKALVKTGDGLVEAPMTEKWTKARKISLIQTGIAQLDCTPKCHNLSTLLLSDNFHLKHIHDQFFLLMPALRVLDLSFTKITRLPTSIGEVLSLEFLGLSNTNITRLPCQVMKLKKLKYLFLDETEKLDRIPCGTIMHLPNLQILKLSDHNFGVTDERMQASVEELASLVELSALEIEISNIKFLGRFLTKQRLVRSTVSLHIDSCQEITSLTISPSLSPYFCLGYMKRLRVLWIVNCSELKELIVNWTEENEMEIGLFENLQVLSLFSLPRLVITWDINQPACFRSLHRLELQKCDAMVNLTWLLLVPNIETVVVDNCQRIEEIISDNYGGDENTFSKLRTLQLWKLPCLQSICKTPLAFPLLNLIQVNSCPELRRLPLDTNSDKHNSLHSIIGNSDWWNNLEWDSATTKSIFTPFFQLYE
ncbi:hypothetical protein IFM89_011204 [Coptis chinensis]|uniref:Disease resistance R13L4/SHOC-2-like LRR domain-containing protein n=1 Tax=Coptis chinensis TaxID=261450 RepID=A0A835HKH8_9MAGN|nr:hypothetical protein IFM89_011204 [Coptis chinensis]